MGELFQLVLVFPAKDIMAMYSTIATIFLGSVMDLLIREAQLFFNMEMIQNFLGGINVRILHGRNA